MSSRTMSCRSMSGRPVVAIVAAVRHASPQKPWRIGAAVVAYHGGTYRGGVQVGGTFYALFGTTLYSYTSLGGAGVALTGAVTGSAYCWFAVNQNAPADIAIVSPGVGAFSVNTSTGAVISYGPPGGPPDPNIGTPNSVVFMFGFFIFTYGSGLTRASNLNSTVINTLNNANAQSKADTLFRPVPMGNGQCLLCGSTTIEVWASSPVNPAGYPFSYVSTIYRGIPGPQAIAGNEDGWGKGIFFVGDDNKVSTLTGYTPTPISVPDLDILIESEPDKSKIIVGVYVSRGHGFVVVQGPNWCWEYDTTIQSWHERASYLQRFWRGFQPICLNFSNSPLWVCGDTLASDLLKIDGTIRKEGGTNDVQTITVTGTPTGGTFKLSFGGIVTGNINFNAAASDVQTALNALPALAGNVSCAGGPFPGTPVVVTFINQLATSPQGLIALATNSLTGGASPNVAIAHTTTGVLPNPLRMRIETGPLGAFPRKVRINTIEVYMTKGASNALGHVPDETNAMIDVSISRDGGQNWGNPRQLTIGQQSITDGRARASIWGQADIQGVRWRFDESAGINYAFMGADMLSDVLR